MLYPNIVSDYLVLKGSTWHVRLDIPIDARRLFKNKKALTKSLRTGNKYEARTRKLLVLDDWKSKISAIRTGQSQFFYKKENKNKAIEELSCAAVNTQAPTEYLTPALTSARIEAWESFLHTQIDKEKTINEYVAKAKALDDYLRKHRLSLNFDSVASFLNEQSSRAKTRSKYLSALRNYWQWANTYDLAIRRIYGERPSPFEKHILPNTKVAQKIPYCAFDKNDVLTIFEEAMKKGNHILALCIVYGIYTGCRIEEIGRIKKEDTHFSETGHPIYFSVKEGKTSASTRDIPIHKNLIPLHLFLCNESLDGFLIKGRPNKYGNRLDYISKSFGRIKRDMGFDSLYVFHSLRKTFTTELHRNGFGESIVPYLLGHEVNNFSLSIYSAGPDMKQKSEAVSTLVFPISFIEINNLIDQMRSHQECHS